MMRFTTRFGWSGRSSPNVFAARHRRLGSSATRAGGIDLFDVAGNRITAAALGHAGHSCQRRRPPLHVWTRPPIGNLALQSFGEVWRRGSTNFPRVRRVAPNIDCQHCDQETVDTGSYDDFFFRMINKPLPVSL
jgi:hypothetical protein